MRIEIGARSDPENRPSGPDSSGQCGGETGGQGVHLGIHADAADLVQLA